MSGAVTHPVSETFPPATFPTVYVDGVLNASVSPAIVKFYFFRFEPSFKGDGQYQTQPVAQVVMSVEGFVASALFFTQHVQNLINSNLISRERVEELRNIVAAPQ